MAASMAPEACKQAGLRVWPERHPLAYAAGLTQAPGLTRAGKAKEIAARVAKREEAARKKKEAADEVIFSRLPRELPMAYP